MCIGTRNQLKALETMIANAVGQDSYLDKAIAAIIVPTERENMTQNYTSSVDDCLSLVQLILPKWRWHLGHGPTGILPYASLTRSIDDTEEAQLRVEASAPTVPLALMGAAIKALIAEQR